MGGRPLDALKRHLQTDLNITEFRFYTGNDELHPFMVFPYIRATSVNATDAGFDPTKQSLGLTYLITTEQQPEPSNKAMNFCWFSSEDELGAVGFNQQIIMKAALDKVLNNQIATAGSQR